MKDSGDHDFQPRHLEVNPDKEKAVETEEEVEKAPEKEVMGKCRVCGGDILEDVRHEHDPTTGPPVIGPGSENQFRDFHYGYYCDDCGLAYKKLPKEIVSTRDLFHKSEEASVYTRFPCKNCEGTGETEKGKCNNCKGRGGLNYWLSAKEVKDIFQEV
jgi:hypothetical protein